MRNIRAKRATVTERGILICLLAGVVAVVMQIMRVEPDAMLNVMYRIVGQDLATQAFVFTSYSVVYLFALIPAGLLLDLFGAKRVLPVGIVVMAAGNTVFAGAENFIQLIQGRVILGVGSAFLMLGAYKLATQWLPRKYFVLFVGLVSGFCMLATGIGRETISSLILGVGVPREHIFALLSSLAVVLAIAIFFAVPHGDYRGEPTNRIGFDHVVGIFKEKQIWLCGIIAGLSFAGLGRIVALFGQPTAAEQFGLTGAQLATLSIISVLSFGVGAIIAGFVAFYTQQTKRVIRWCCFGAVPIFVFLLFVPLSIYPLLMIFTALMCGVVGGTYLVPALAYEYCNSTDAGITFALVSTLTIAISTILMSALDFFSSTPSPMQTKLALSIVPLTLLYAGWLLRYFKKPEAGLVDPKGYPYEDLRSCWRGKAPLGRCFWITYVAGGSMVFLFVFLITALISLTSDPQWFVLKPLFALTLLLILPYLLFSLVCVWRCRHNITRSVGWSYIAPAVVVLDAGYCLLYLIGYIVNLN